MKPKSKPSIAKSKHDQPLLTSESRKIVDKSQIYKRLQHLVAPHVESFNYFISKGLQEAIADIPPLEIYLAPSDISIKLYFTSDYNIAHPSTNDSVSASNKLTPREAREREMSYTGQFIVNVKVELSTGQEFSHLLKCGELPIMVKSEKCHLHGMSNEDMVYMKEEENEVGGYFIVNGIERVVRLLQVPRRNFPTAIERSSYKKRGNYYSDKGVIMRCVRQDQTSVTMTLHYLTNGNITLRFTLRKQEFLIPVIIIAKALHTPMISDKELFDRIVQNDVSNTFLTTRLELLLRDTKNSYHIYSQSQALAYLGKHFRQFLPISEKSHNDESAGKMLMERYIFIHTDSFSEKLDTLLFLIKKLFSFVQGNTSADNADAIMNHEVLLPGHLMNMMIKEKLEDTLINMKGVISRDYRANRTKALSDMKHAKYYAKNFDRFASSIGNKMSSFLSTGNVVSSTGLDLMQVSGYTIVAERLNYHRFLSHFQSVHRGQFFTTMKTTLVRKLLPESWGFMCPVHTPDGSPCGLLNHLTRDCVILCYPPTEKLPSSSNNKFLSYLCNYNNITNISPAAVETMHKIQLMTERENSKGCYWLQGKDFLKLLVGLGVKASGLGSPEQHILGSEYMTVLLDGVVLGGVPSAAARSFVSQLRFLKIYTKSVKAHARDSDQSVGDSVSDDVIGNLDPTMEVVYIPFSRMLNQAFPGIYLFTSPGRMIRPVFNLAYQCIEWIGPMEQVFMDIACTKADLVDNPNCTHIELSPTVMLSQIASFTPYSDYNQSPRNMYQCQMGKQTMGNPTHAWKHRSDNKLYRIQNVQSPLVRTRAYMDYNMDEYAQGVNAVVAVISFTGYDMEDAMIINKASYERGWGHGSMYKTRVYNLDEEEKMSMRDGIKPQYVFSNIKKLRNFEKGGGEGEGEGDEGDGSGVELFCDHLDFDGLPFEGQHIKQGDTIVCMVDILTGKSIELKHKDAEPCFVDAVRVIGRDSNSNSARQGRVGVRFDLPSDSDRYRRDETSVNGVNYFRDKHSLRKLSITMRYRRNPVIGDKFSSRHGQKGTLSVLWPQQNMPFTEQGMTPDVLINPHAFPSRMTIGMLVESMGGKASALHGEYQDATPFRFHEEQKVIDYMGEQLRANGYHYYGSEPLYNGLTGNIMQADIFIGLVYYQRLRHMVSDKYQVRATGPINSVTRQPVGGRKKHGGIRLGEMERDSLISHGVAFCLQDRLMNCSDTHLAYVCSTCGNLLTVYSRTTAALRHVPGAARAAKAQYCTLCESSDGVKPIRLPYVYRYLTNELAAMGVKLTLKLSDY